MRLPRHALLLLCPVFVACSGRAPSPCFEPTLPRCTILPDPNGRTLDVVQQSNCASGQLCLPGPDSGVCVPDAPFMKRKPTANTSTDGEREVAGVRASCDGCGTCRFVTGTIAGLDAPVEGCVADGPSPGCCDQASSCTFTF